MRGKLLPLGVLLLIAPSASAQGPEKVPSPPATAVPVLRSELQVRVPLDELLTGHANLKYAFLVMLDSTGRPTALLLLEGDTLFLPEVSEALRKESFDQSYANRQVVIEGAVASDPAPLPRGQPTVIALDDVRHATPADEERIQAADQRASAVEPCTAEMDKDAFIRKGNQDERYQRKDEAFRCFQMALSKAPDSIAALDGASRTCDEKNDARCPIQYLDQILRQRPDFYEDRERRAYADGTSQDESRTVLELQRILSENPPPPVQLSILGKLFYFAQHAGDSSGEALYRRQWSEIARRYFALYPEQYGVYSRISIVFNDEPLAILLEGMQRWNEAEEIYRRNLSLIAVDPLFEKEVKFDNELGLARSLAAQGKGKDSAQICSQWKWRRGFVARHGSAFSGYASGPVETAKWDLSCGKEQDGLAMLGNEAAQHPWMYGVFIALRDYYYAHGDVQDALKADGQSSRAHDLADARILSNMR